MFSQTIRTSKYTATIDIPAQKLYTRSKFIQIPKPRLNEQQIVVVPATCSQQNCYHSNKSTSSSLQIKFMVQELQKAYNDDMQTAQKKYYEMENMKNKQIMSQNDILRQLKDKSNTYSGRCKQLQTALNDTNKYSQSQLNRYRTQTLELKRQLETITSQNIRLKQDNQILLVQKNNLVKTKIRQFQNEKDKIWNDRLNSLQISIRQKMQNQRRLQVLLAQAEDTKEKLLQNIVSQREQHKQTQQELIKLQINFNKANEDKNALIEKIASHDSTLQTKQKQKANLNQLLMVKIRENQQLFLQISKQRQVLQAISIKPFNSKNEDIHVLEQLHKQQAQILAQKVVDLQTILGRKQDELNLKQQKIILISAECIKLKKNIQIIESTFELENNKKQELLSKINELNSQNQKLHIQLSKKTIQYNHLLNNPQEKVYSVKIEKTIDKKQYIQQLQAKLTLHIKIIEQLKQDNESYVQEIRKRIMGQESLKNKSKILEQSIDELKTYIKKKENSLAWVVDRQIARDVQLSRNSSQLSSQAKKQNQAKQKTRGYKVFVNEEEGAFKNQQSIIKNIKLKGYGNDASQILVMKPQNKKFDQSM